MGDSNVGRVIRLGENKEIYIVIAGLLAVLALMTLLWVKSFTALQAGVGFIYFGEVTNSPSASVDAGKISNSDFPWHGVEVWHQQGYKGNDIKVGIIDEGFGGFSDKIGRTLPPAARVHARCYLQAYPRQYTDDITDCEWGEPTAR